MVIPVNLTMVGKGMVKVSSYERSINLIKRRLHKILPLIKALSTAATKAPLPAVKLKYLAAFAEKVRLHHAEFEKGFTRILKTTADVEINDQTMITD